MLQNFQNFSKNESGQVALVIGLLAIPIMGTAGIALDYSRTYQTKSDLQQTVDAAAFAGASANTANNGERRKIAEDFFEARNVWNIKPTISFANDQITVSASYEVPTTLMNVLTDKPVTVDVEAVVNVGSGQNDCVYVLNPTASDALKITSSGTFTSDCVIQVNSDNTNAFTFNTSGTIRIPEINVFGNSSGSHSGTFDINIKNNQPSKPDPLASMPEPVEKGDPCDFNNHPVVVASSSATVSPGVYCGGLSTVTSGHLEFLPGVYVFRNGPLSITGSGSITGNGVLFYFEDDASYFNSTASGKTSFSGPATGAQAGVLIFQGRNSTAPSGTYKAIVSGDNEQNGVLYVPNAHLEFTFSGTNTLSHHVPVVADTLKFVLSGDNSISNDSSTTNTVVRDELQKKEGNLALAR